MIELSSVNFDYGENTILKDFSLTVNDGECICLKGESGSGKTTVAMIILGLRKQTSGIVTVPEKISAVFQDDRFVESLTLQKNLKMCLDDKQYGLACELLKRLNMYSSLNKKISELSGGMKRRAAIVRAVAFGGDAIILDEAFNGIDEENKKICSNIIKEYFLDKNKPILIITHIDSDAELLNAKTIILNKTDDK